MSKIKPKLKLTSKTIPNYQLINRNPDKYIKEHISSTDQLDRLIKEANHLYYNLGFSGLTDNSYDALVYHYHKRTKKSPTKIDIGAPTTTKHKITLPVPMPSLNKVKLKQLSAFLHTIVMNKSELLWSLKLDGVSCLLVYQSGQLTGIYTRGNGLIGGDISYLKTYLKSVPCSLTNNLSCMIRGELVLKKDTWKEHYHNLYVTPRHMVCAQINSTTLRAEDINRIEFIAYQLVTPTGKWSTESETFKYLETLGLSVVNHGLLTEVVTCFQIVSIYHNRRSSSSWPIDGLVLTDNRRSFKVPSKLENPTDSIAFKMCLQEQIRETKVLDIEWQISRYGRCTPVVTYEAVYIDSCRMTRATAHNALYIKKWGLGRGSIIKVVRSGDVIPQIIEVPPNQTGIQLIWPPVEWDWEWRGPFIYLKYPDHNDQVLIQRLLYFFETLQIPRIGPKTCEKFFQVGLIYPEDVIHVKLPTLLEIRGIGQKSGTNMIKAIEQQTQQVPIDRLVIASNLLQGIGRKLIKVLLQTRPQLLTMTSEQIRNNLKTDKIAQFGPKRIEMIAQNLPKFAQYLQSLKIDRSCKVDYKINFNPKIKDKKFVLTGFYGHDSEMIDLIYDAGGTIVSGVSNQVEAVIASNILEISNKMMQAENQKIPVLAVDEFKKQYIN